MAGLLDNQYWAPAWGRLEVALSENDLKLMLQEAGFEEPANLLRKSHCAPKAVSREVAALTTKAELGVGGGGAGAGAQDRQFVIKPEPTRRRGGAELLGVIIVPAQLANRHLTPGSTSSAFQGSKYSPACEQPEDTAGYCYLILLHDHYQAR
ncbi:unnamed protein product [Clonostachys rosea f. rosea IK726]|uniref:Uncharacterized protein n=1 Tax=Clonostachys rosea f. rosea IK726 TaxID=1349383 RepID=A0ACA9TRW3_BIOOC|nr:unnamed protein product [Clonostachys rosea f. rosea IK726]